MKRFVYILIIGVVAIGAVLIGYLLRYPCEQQPFPPVLNIFLRFRCAAPPSGGLPEPAEGLPIVPGTPVQGTSGKPEVGAAQPEFPQVQKFGVVSNEAIMDFFVDNQNNVIAIQPNGKIIKIAGGQTTLLSDSVINNFIAGAFSFDGKKILATFGESKNTLGSVFDVETKSWQPLPADIQNPSWSPKDYNIAYFSPAGTAMNLAILDLNNPKAKPLPILKLNEQDLKINWAGANQLLFSDPGSAGVKSSLWGFSLKEKTLTPILEDWPGLDFIWDGNSNQGLVFASNASKKGGWLSLVDKNGVVFEKLNFLTLASKCSFGLETKTTSTSPVATTTGRNASGAEIITRFLICAIPRDTQKLGLRTLPDDYKKKAVFTTDDFYAINLSNGDVQAIFTDPTQFLDAESLKVFNKKLFFLNRFDQKLYAISLSEL
jgi:hypothetical protein